MCVRGEPLVSVARELSCSTLEELQGVVTMEEEYTNILCIPDKLIILITWSMGVRHKDTVLRWE